MKGCLMDSKMIKKRVLLWSMPIVGCPKTPTPGIQLADMTKKETGCPRKIALDDITTVNGSDVYSWQLKLDAEARCEISHCL